MKTKKKSPIRRSGNSKWNLNDTTLPAQRKRLLEWLREKPITTIEARERLNILMPAARIFELRKNYGLNIITHWTQDRTSQGKPHRVARYALMPDKNENADNG
ncbi:MAG: helix-turn-helix domain-containing protein [Gammaproteobacteria bacterium]|jgi:hypothetical protein